MPPELPQMGPGPPRAYPDPRELSAQLAAREGSGAATCHADAGAGGDRSDVLAAPAGGVVVTVGGTVSRRGVAAS